MKTNKSLPIPYMLTAFIALFAIAGVAQFYWYQMHAPHRPKVEVQDTIKREFIFQVDDFKTKNQGGQTITMYFHYRYDEGIAETEIPDYRKLREFATQYMDTVDVVANPYWETISQGMCKGLKEKFPIEAISCQLQIASDTRQGLANPPGVRSTITTIGEIDSLRLAQ